MDHSVLANRSSAIRSLTLDLDPACHIALQGTCCCWFSSCPHLDLVVNISHHTPDVPTKLFPCFILVRFGTNISCVMRVVALSRCQVPPSMCTSPPTRSSRASDTWRSCTASRGPPPCSPRRAASCGSWTGRCSSTSCSRNPGGR